jgi:hypothetical protein
LFNSDIVLIGFVDGNFIKIHKPWNNPAHYSWFNGQKKMCCMNNTVVMDNRGLFIYLHLGYPRSYHDIKILRQLDIHKSWHQYFVHTYEYFEYLLGDPSYMGEDMFVICRIGRRELMLGIHMDVVRAYNKMHASLTFHSILQL